MSVSLEEDEKVGSLGGHEDNHEDASEDNSEDHDENNEGEESSEDEQHEDESESEEETPVTKAKHKNGFAKRITRLNRNLDAARREAEHWRNMATSASSDKEEKEPDEEAYGGDMKKYASDLAKYHAKKAVQEARKEDRDRESEHRQKELNEAWESKVEEVLEEHPDYHEKVSAVQDIHLHNDILNEIKESDHGARITYHLASHPRLLKELSKLPAKEAIKRIHKIEGLIENSESLDTHDRKPIQQSRAPHPTKPIKASAGSTNDKKVDDMTADELDAWLKKGNTVKFGGSKR